MAKGSNDNEKPEQAFLRVVASDGVTHLLPYGHLLHASLTSNDGVNDSGRIEMLFAVHSVSVEGSGLKTILNQIQNLTLQAISSSRGEKGITKIEVNESARENG